MVSMPNGTYTREYTPSWSGRKQGRSACVRDAVYVLASGATRESSWKPGRRIPADDEKDLTVTSRIPEG